MGAQPLRGPIGVVGLGLIGGSLGLDLQQLGLEVRALVHREGTAQRARERQLAQVVSREASVLSGCQLVVLALPLDRLLDPPAELLAALPPEAVITDVGSVKQPILARWQGLHPRFVPSHPMAGTADSGVEAGIAGLFRSRPWVATPPSDGDPEALAAVAGLARALGALWFTCDAADHDRAVALISHLPVLVSAALLANADQAGALSVAGSSLPQLVRVLASSGFADTTRVGGGNPELGTLMARWNRAAVVDALLGYRHCLDRLERHLNASDWPALRTELERCQQLRPEFL
jgi:arogenate dehydrogenase (NADP+)